MKNYFYLLPLFSFNLISCTDNPSSGRCIECTGLTSVTYSACENEPSEFKHWSPSYIEKGYTWEDHVEKAMLSAQILGDKCTETFN